MPWYYTFLSYIDLVSSSDVEWSVSGNSSNGIAGFNYTDNTPFPKCNFTVPTSVNLNNSLTVNFTNIGTNDGVFVTVYAYGNQKITKSVAANGTSAVFSSSELRSIASSGAQLGIQVMPVKLTPVTLSGKTYYFVKQWAFAQFTEVL